MASAVRYLKAAGRLAWHEARHRGNGPGLLRQSVEWRDVTADASTLRRYIQATNGVGLRWMAGDEAVLPPLFPTIWETGMVLELLTRPDAPSLRGGVIHLETEFVQVRPGSADGAFRCRLDVEGVERDASGVGLRVVTRCWTMAGQLCSESTSTYLIRDRERPRKESVRDGEIGFDGNYRELSRWKLRRDHGRRFARASGDYNPIHLSRLTAAVFGFRRPILHGFCIAAIAVNEILLEQSGGDPVAFRRMRVSFRRGLPIPSSPRLEVTRGSGRTLWRLVGDRERLYAEGDLVAAR
jgi:acyl dehydratase